MEFLNSTLNTIYSTVLCRMSYNIYKSPSLRLLSRLSLLPIPIFLTLRHHPVERGGRRHTYLVELTTRTAAILYPYLASIEQAYQR